jgi:hypothetical protein
MTSVTLLIAATTPHIPFANEAAAQAFLNQYDVNDQAALISALYIGRDHIHHSSIRPGYVPNGYAFDRFFQTGDASNWLISPAGFASILHEKNTNLSVYYDAFRRCVPASSLTNF